MKKTTTALTFLFLLGFAGVAAAQPSGACDGETGAAWGLCNAYCDAMDCDGEPEASLNACTKVLDKFEQITGNTPPCEVLPPCPCIELDSVFASFVNGEITIQTCLASGNFAQLTGFNSELLQTGNDEMDGPTCGAGIGGAGSYDITAAEQVSCFNDAVQAAADQGVACN